MENQALMPVGLNKEDGKYNEEWRVVMNTGGKYILSKIQARILQQAIATGNRGIVMFNTFSIPIPYIAEFFRVKRFLVGAKLLPSRASEPEYKPIDPKKFEEWKKEIYRKIGRSMPKGGKNG